MSDLSEITFTPALIDLPTAAKMLGGISKTSQRKLIVDGILPVVKVGHRTMVRPTDVEACVAALAAKSAARRAG